MSSYVVMTVLGADRAGLVRGIAETVARHGGNWLESRMARMAGQFAGIIKIAIAPQDVAALVNELQGPSHGGLTIHAAGEMAADPCSRQTLRIEVFANDRPGIIRELASAIAGAGGNVEELTSGIESAPMSGQPMFRAKVDVSLGPDRSELALIESIESLGADLTVDIVRP